MADRILVIEDEEAIRQLLEMALVNAGYETLMAADGEDGVMIATDSNPDLILLDWMLPLVSGIEVLRQLRRHGDTRHIPVIMLTARGEESDRVRGLDSGADDYITKPFSPAELLARVRALLRRSRGEVDEVLRCADLEINMTERRCLRGGVPVHLGPKEFRLLEVLLRNQGRVYSRALLLDLVWGQDADIELRTVDVHIRRLRKAVNAHGPDLIRTVRAMGYAIEPPVSL